MRKPQTQRGTTFNHIKRLYHNHLLSIFHLGYKRTQEFQNDCDLYLVINCLKTKIMTKNLSYNECMFKSGYHFCCT